MTEPTTDLLRKIGLAFPGLAAAAEWSPTARLHHEQQQAEQHYFGKCLALGLTIDDARMVLDRERAVTAQYRFSSEQMWARTWDQALRYCMREPYEPFPEQAEYLRNLIRQASTPDPA